MSVEDDPRYGDEGRDEYEGEEPRWLDPDLDKRLDPDAPVETPDEGDDSSRGELPEDESEPPPVSGDEPGVEGEGMA